METTDSQDRPERGGGQKRAGLEVDRLFAALVKLRGSDLHLRVGLPPGVRIKGSLRPLNRGPIDREEMARLCKPLLDERTRPIFERDGGADFAYTVECDGEERRFRVNLLQQLGNYGLVARLVNNFIPDL